MEETTKQEIAKNISKFTDLVIEPVKQRTAHPFISSYLISGLFVNWKAISCLLFSSKIIEDKIKYIETTFYPDESSKTFAIVIPLLIALLYTMVLKWFDIFIDAVNNIPINYRILNQSKIKVNTLEAQIDIVKAQIKLNNARAENKELEDLNEKISHLNKEIELKDESLHANQLENYKLIELNTSIGNELNTLKGENLQLAIESSNSSLLKKNMESLLRTMFMELERDTLVEILQKTMPNEIPKEIIALADEAYEEKNNAPTHAYRIEMKDDHLTIDLNRMKEDFSRISNKIGVMMFRENKDGNQKNVLEITYPNYLVESRIKTIIDKHISK